MEHREVPGVKHKSLTSFNLCVVHVHVDTSVHIVYVHQYRYVCIYTFIVMHMHINKYNCTGVYMHM